MNARVSNFNRMLYDCPPMMFTIGQQLKSDPWLYKRLRCLNCTEEYDEVRREGDIGTRCPNCFDLDRDFKWERKTSE